MATYLKRKLFVKATLILFLLYSCSKNDPSTTNTSPVKLSSCDSIKQGLLKTQSDTIRLASCLTITSCDSIRLGLLKPTTADTIRLPSCIKIYGCDSIRLSLLKPSTADTIRLATCIKMDGCDSVRLALLKPTKLDSARLSCLQPSFGKYWGGGIVAYILTASDPGYDPTTRHGLIVSDKDIQSLTPWSSSYGNTGVTSKTFGSGLNNTNRLVSLGGNTAASICKAYRGGGFSDWFLPSKDELSKLWPLSPIIGMQGKRYWSSSECAVFEGGNTGGLYNWYSAWCHDFSTGSGVEGLAIAQLKDKQYYVRAVRSF